MRHFSEQGCSGVIEEEEDARRKSEGRVAPFIGMMGRAVLQGDDGVRRAGGWDRAGFAWGATGSERAMS